jgi:sugar transferase (PEP-CTERM/EpsH1 system associated)
MRILFLAQRVPYPPDRGDKITTWRLVERMRRRHELRVIAFAHDAADRAAARELEARGIETIAVPLHARLARLRALALLLGSKPITLGVYGSRAMRAEVERRAGWPDLVYAYSSSMGAYFPPRGPDARPRRVMHFAELDSDKWRQYAERTPFPWSSLWRREARTLLAFESELARSADENVLCTPLEQAIFQERIPGAPSMVLRNGVDLAGLAPAPEAAEPGRLVFVGVMDYYPNVEGCLWFTREILPRVRERVPGVTLSIVGARPTRAVRALAREPGVTVTGFVADPAEHLRRAALSIAPLRIARGIQNKVLEAMAMGLPIVGTSAATRGTEGEPGRHFLVADDAERQAHAIVELLEDRARAAELGRAARSFVEQRYPWEAVLRPLDELLERLRPAPSHGSEPSASAGAADRTA